MPETKFTRGPLEVRKQEVVLGDDGSCPDYGIIADGRYVIAEVFGYVGAGPQDPRVGTAVADAHLYAAAPDLYEACAAVLASGEYIHLEDSVIGMLRDAIVKADGPSG